MGRALRCQDVGVLRPPPTATRLMTDATSPVRVVPPVTVPDLDRFARLDSVGLTVTGQQIFPNHAVLFCQVTVPDDRCPGCGGQARRHDTVAAAVHASAAGTPPDLAAGRDPTL